METPLKTIVEHEEFGVRVVYYERPRDPRTAVLVLRWHHVAVWTLHGLQFIGQLLSRNDGNPGEEWIIVWEGYDGIVYHFESRTDDLGKAITLVEEDFNG
jgi:hypothetical protein